MSKRLKTFIITFILVGTATFFLWYLANGIWVQAIKLGVVRGVTVGILITFGSSFIKNHKAHKNQDKDR